MLTSLTSRTNYPGAGSVGPFTIPFRWFDDNDLLVTHRSAANVEVTLVLDVDFTVTGTGEETGELTLTTALAIGETLSIRRAPELTQRMSIRDGGQYFPDTVEDEVDRLVMQLQSIEDALRRSFGLTESFDPGVVSTRLRPETGKVLVWQSATELGNSALDASATALPGGGRSVATVSAYLLNNAVFNVKDFGAVGDGVANDTAAIAAAELAANGNEVYFPPGLYLFDYIRTRGTVPIRFRGAGRLITRLVQTAAANVGITLGYNGNVEGCELCDIWLQGNATATGGISVGTVAQLVAFFKMERCRVSDYTRVGGYGLAFYQAQEIDIEDCSWINNYNNLYRPSTGFLTSCLIHGQYSYLGLATHRGASLEGLCSDIAFKDIVVESNAFEGIFADGYPSVITIENCYLEGNCVSGGTAQIAINGGNPFLYQAAQVRFIRNNIHISANPAKPTLRLNLVRLSTIADNKGLDADAGILTTADVQVHFANNSDNDASDYVAIYRALLGTISAEDNASLGQRFVFGNRTWKDAHLSSDQGAAPTIAIQVAQAGTAATAALDANATDVKMVATINGGSAAWNAGIQAKVTFNKTYTRAPVVILVPGNHFAALAIGTNACRVDNVTLTTFDIVFGIAATAQHQYLFNIIVIE